MSKILVIGLGSPGRNVCKKLKDDGLDAKFVTFGGFYRDGRDDIPHHSFVHMKGFYNFHPSEEGAAQGVKLVAENNKDEIRKIIEELL